MQISFSNQRGNRPGICLGHYQILTLLESWLTCSSSIFSKELPNGWAIVTIGDQEIILGPEQRYIFSDIIVRFGRQYLSSLEQVEKTWRSIGFPLRLQSKNTFVKVASLTKGLWHLCQSFVKENHRKLVESRYILRGTPKRLEVLDSSKKIQSVSVRSI